MNRHTLYNKYKRNNESKRFYNSKAWEVCRTNVLRRDYYLCQECLENKVIKAYDVVHHIKPLKDYSKLSLTESNLVSLCHACHSVEESKTEIKERNINVVELESNPEII